MLLIFFNYSNKVGFCHLRGQKRYEPVNLSTHIMQRVLDRS